MGRGGEPEHPLESVRRTIVGVSSGGTCLFVLAMLLTTPLRGDGPMVQALFFTEMVVYAAAFLLHRRDLTLAGALMCIASLGLIVLMGLEREGIRSSSVIVGLACLTFVSALGWSVRGAFVIAALSSVAVGFFVYRATPPLEHGLVIFIELAFQFFVIPVVAMVTLGALNKSNASALAHASRFEKLFSYSPEALIAFDSQGVVSMLNPSAASLVGKTREECQGEALRDLGWLSEDLAGQVLRARHTVDGDAETTEFSFRDNKERILEASLSALESSGTAEQWLLSIRDVTERFEAERARRAWEARIAESKSIEALGRLAGGVAHDFNNLLTVILGTSENLRHDVKDPEVQEELKHIETAAQNGAELTSELLAFGRRQVLEPKVLSPREALDRLQPLLRRLLPEYIELSVDHAPGVGNIAVDESKLDQVVMNLVANARDALPEGGRVSIACANRTFRREDLAELPGREPGDYVEILVSDTGAGIPAHVLARIFEPFFTTKEGGGGTGLGLATVHGIVIQSGGHIDVDSQEGQGTTFRLLFPRADRVQFD